MRSPSTRPTSPLRALARLGDVARGATPLFGALGALADQAVEEWLSRKLGERFASRLARVPLHLGTAGVDPFGLDPRWAKYAIAFVTLLHRHYFRTDVYGIEHVPPGRVLFIANHSGQIPMDAMLIGAALFDDAEPPRIVRAMVEKWVQTLPFISLAYSRFGQVVGVPENARRLLEQDEALLVFPEGARGISKTYDQRYRLADFGLGFMRLAIETSTPIVPVAVVGGEEQYISVANMKTVAKVLGMPAFPIIPQLLIPGGQLPLPTKYRLYFGEPMTFTGDPDEDDAVMEEKVWVVRSTIQSMLQRGLKERRSVFF